MIKKYLPPKIEGKNIKPETSAVHRPQSGYYENLYEMAAALLHSLISNHVFVDGNKRVAFASCDVFLLRNGIELSVDTDEAEDFLIKKVIQEKLELKEITEWLKNHSNF